jgi:nucleoid DNA-binding protein
LGRSLTRADLHRALSARTDLSMGESERLVSRVLDLIGTSLAEGETVKLTGFGTLEVRSRAARKGRNPKTGEAYPVNARRVVVFTPSARLKAGLDGHAQKADDQD